jgi:polysaccharide export outer membrane protein
MSRLLNFTNGRRAAVLTEMQIEQAAMSQGYTLSDIAKMRQRMAKIRQQTNRTGQFSADSLINRAQQGTLSQRPYALGDSLNLLRRDTIRRPYIFGAALFKGTALTFEPNLRIATPRNYIVGPRRRVDRGSLWKLHRKLPVTRQCGRLRPDVEFSPHFRQRADH